MKLEEVNLKTKEAVDYLVQSLEAGHSREAHHGSLGASLEFADHVETPLCCPPKLNKGLQTVLVPNPSNDSARWLRRAI